MPFGTRKGGQIEPRVDPSDWSARGYRAVPEAPRTSGAGAESAAVISLARRALHILAGKNATGGRAKPRLSSHYVDAFCRALVSGKMQVALNLTRVYASRGATYGDIAEDLFAEATRRMGVMWCENHLSIIQVNVGVATLIRTHVAFCSALRPASSCFKGSALFGAFPGQVHTLGLVLGSEFFRRNGWRARYIPGTGMGDFAATVSVEAPDIVGLTAATERDLHVLREAIVRLKDLPNPPRIIVGGTAPGLASLEADAVVSRLDMALLASHRLLRC